MAKKLTKAQLDAYFNQIIADYSESPAAKYFGDDIADIIARAQSGLKGSLKAGEKQEIYNELILKVDGLNNKIDGCLEELKDNLSRKGASSPLGGTFYYRSTEGDDKADVLVAVADEAIGAKTFGEKAKGFDKVAGLFSEYVDNSTLVSSLDSTDHDNAKKNNVSLAKVYTNAVNLEKYLHLREENSEIYKLLDNPSHAKLRRDTAAPFKYYSLLAGIKTGKIKQLTTQQISDLQWVYQNNPALFPKDSLITNKAIKTDPELQKKLLESLKNQHDEKTIREELIKYKKNLAEDPDILAASLDNTKAFAVGVNTAGRNARRGLIAGAIALAIVGVHVGVNVLDGMADPTVGKVLEQLVANGRIWNTLLPVLGGTGTVVGINAARALGANKTFMNKYNETNRVKLMKYLTANREKWNDKTKRAEMIAYVNREHENLLGDHPKMAERLLDILMRGIDEQTSIASSRDRKAKRGEGVETTSITGKRDIQDFARNIGLSKDNPLSHIMSGVLSRIGVELPKKRVAFATRSETAGSTPVTPVEEERRDVVVEEPVTPVAEETRTVEDEIDNAISVVKSHINADAVTLDVKIGEIEYELSIERTGPKGGKLNTGDLDKALGKVQSYLREGVKSFTVTAESDPSKIPVVKHIKKPASVSIKMKKKDPNTPGGR